MLLIIKILLTFGCIISFMLYINKTSGKKDSRLWQEPEGILFIALFIISGLIIVYT